MPLTFPFLKIGLPVTREIGMWDTSIETAMSGKDNRYANSTQPRYRYEINLEGLDSSGANAALINNSMQTLHAFFNQAQGRFAMWQWFDVDDNLATAQTFGTGDGVSNSFQLTRTLFGMTENVYAPLNSAGPTLVPAPGNKQVNATFPAPVIKDNGVTKSSPADYFIGPTGVVAFTYIPTAGHALTWTGQYYWLASFDDDSMPLSKDMGNIWSMKALKFTTRIP